MTEEKENKPSFALYLLFSEGLQFVSSEIETAVLEDFPTLDIQRNPVLSFPFDCDTDGMIPTAPIFFGSGGADGCGVVNMMRLPGYGQWQIDQVTPSQRIGAADIDLADAFARNRSYLCVSVSAKSSELADVFRAARLCSCLGAVFARLPICLAAYWETGDHFLSPSRIVSMAETAMKDEWPLTEWLGLRLDGRGQDESGRYWAAGNTKGLETFAGYELTLPAAPLEAAAVAATLYATAWLPVANGSVLKDGDTCGPETEAEGPPMRLRWLPKGASAPQHGTPPVPTDTFVLMHPESPFDIDAYFGPPNPKEAGVRVIKTTQRPKPNFSKRVLGKGA